MMIGVNHQVRPAVLTDQRQITNLINSSPQVHRHLDWRSPVDWIGLTPFYVLEADGQIVAALGCPPEPPSIAWMRLFVNSGRMAARESWQELWQAARDNLFTKGKFNTAAIVLQGWFHEILVSSDFTSHQSIIMLERVSERKEETVLASGFSLRPMLSFDLPAVAEVDSEAFELLWQNPLPVLERAYPQAIWASVAEFEGRVIGYQLSTRNSLGVHLARLAVRPEVQGNGIGQALVMDLIQQAGRHGISHFTVNTQSDNFISQALYQRLGFRETGERYPVYQFQV
jgi:ribosomal-protein-alanine N-acetyltransferase